MSELRSCLGVCGEAGILSEGNPAAYSVVTDTLVHAVSIHKVDRFSITF